MSFKMLTVHFLQMAELVWMLVLSHCLVLMNNWNIQMCLFALEYNTLLYIKHSR